ncbi:MAG: hypothetical protein ABJG68_00175 [Crocinitomicaceae bacterium]
MRYFFLTAIFLSLFACNSTTDIEQLSSCRTIELTEFEHRELSMDLKLPVNWETEIDFIFGDTLGVTSIDTAYYNLEQELLMFGWMQYSTTISDSANFQVVQNSIAETTDVELLKKGEISTGSNSFKYLLIYEYGDVWKDNPMTNLLAFKQLNGQVITCFSRVQGRTTELEDFCHFVDILEQVGK